MFICMKNNLIRRHDLDVNKSHAEGSYFMARSKTFIIYTSEVLGIKYFLFITEILS